MNATRVCHVCRLLWLKGFLIHPGRTRLRAFTKVPKFPLLSFGCHINGRHLLESWQLGAPRSLCTTLCLHRQEGRLQCGFLQFLPLGP